MRVTIDVDSATPNQVYELTLAFQRARLHHNMPNQITKLPTVKVQGQAMSWISPALTVENVDEILDLFRDIWTPDWKANQLVDPWLAEDVDSVG